MKVSESSVRPIYGATVDASFYFLTHNIVVENFTELMACNEILTKNYWSTSPNTNALQILHLSTICFSVFSNFVQHDQLISLVTVTDHVEVSICSKISKLDALRTF